MKRLTSYHLGEKSTAYMACSRTCTCDTLCGDCAELGKIIARLAAYEDAMPIERAQELAQAEKDGRLVVLPKVSKHDRESFADGLHDYFQEASFCDPSTGIFGMSEGEKELAYALMNVLTCEEAEAALKKREADNEAD